MKDGTVSAGTTMFFSLNPRTGLLQVIHDLRNDTYGNVFTVCMVSTTIHLISIPVTFPCFITFQSFDSCSMTKPPAEPLKTVLAF